jgi:AbiV family abortive infection protein
MQGRLVTIRRKDAGLNQDQPPPWLFVTQNVEVGKLADGVKTCLSNVQQFLDEAEILLNNGFLRHPIGLLELAEEEMGKAQHIVDVFEDATIAGHKRTGVTRATFRKHLAKLAFAPIPWVPSHSQRERHLRSRFASSGASIRERSFYVDYQRGRWAWGNSNLEDKKTILFLIRELRNDCRFLRAVLHNVLVVRQMIQRRGLHDQRTQDLMKKRFGRTTDTRRSLSEKD